MGIFFLKFNFFIGGGGKESFSRRVHTGCVMRCVPAQVTKRVRRAGELSSNYRKPYTSMEDAPIARLLAQTTKFALGAS